VAYDAVEQEQVDSLKQFWDKNGKSLIGGIVVGLALFFGYQSWTANKGAAAEAASIEYMGMLEALSSNELGVAAEYGSRVIGSYADTAYAPLTALVMARIKLEQGDSVTARAHLNWAINHSDMPEIQNIARIRLADVLLSEGLTDQALAALDKVKATYVASQRDEVRGDIYVSLNQIDKAQKAYKDALAALTPEGDQRAQLLQIKLDDITGL